MAICVYCGERITYDYPCCTFCGRQIPELKKWKLTTGKQVININIEKRTRS